MVSVSRELIEKFSKRTQQIEQIAKHKYTVINARARARVKQTGMEFAGAFAQIKSEIGAESGYWGAMEHLWNAFHNCPIPNSSKWFPLADMTYSASRA
jgi:hypothetical protein